MIPQGLRKLWLSRIEIYPMLCLGKLWAERAGARGPCFRLPCHVPGTAVGSRARAV